MDEYIKREDALDAVLFALVGTGYQSMAIRAIRDVPTADVAPRAEIDKLQEVNADLNESLRLAAEANKDLQAEVDRLRFNLNAVLDERAEDKAEVAREIFEELDKIMLPLLHEVSQVYFYAKLKKKYTEADPPKAKQPKDSENYEKKRLLPGDCFHGEIWCRCPYCLTGIEAHSIPKNRICHKCGKEYL